MALSADCVLNPRLVPAVLDHCDLIDPTAGDLIPLTQVPGLPWMPRNPRGKPIHVNTVWRWHYRGVRGVKLPTTLIGGCRFTSVVALRDFFRRISGPASTQDVPSTGTRRRQRDLAAAQVAELLRPQGQKSSDALTETGVPA